MSVTSALYTGVAGLLSNSEGINVIGNNLANVNTVGFKGSRIGFSDLLSVTVGNTVGSNNQIGRGVQIQKIDNTFSQGSFENTENVSDVAIQGDSFFVLGATDSVAGTAILGTGANYTRAGSFRITPDPTTPLTDKFLTNPDGLRVLDEDGMPIHFSTTATPAATDFVRITSVDPQGRITFLRYDNATAYYDGNAGGTLVQVDAKKIGTLNIPGKNYLEKVGGSVFRPTSTTAGVPTTAATAMYSATYNPTTGLATSEKLFSSSLEQSNVDMAAQFVKMILTQRAYSANSKTITTADQMTQELLNLKQ
jgi:flagellar hook protein FlgE